jgi:hypothetical protein
MLRTERTWSGVAIREEPLATEEPIMPKITFTIFANLRTLKAGELVKLEGWGSKKFMCEGRWKRDNFCVQTEST